MRLLAHICLLVFWSTLSHAQVGAIGNSITDEYPDEVCNYAETWVEILVDEVGVDFGRTALEAAQPGGTWGVPRRTLYEYNWALAGDTTGTAIIGGQHTGLAAQVAANGVDQAIVFVGTADILVYFDDIYDGTWGKIEILAAWQTIYENLIVIIDELQDTGVSVILVTPLDPGVSPFLQGTNANDEQREWVQNSILYLVEEIRTLGEKKKLILVDFYRLWYAIFGRQQDLNVQLLVGNTAIDLTASDTAVGATPTAAFTDDTVHPNSVLQAIHANVLLEAINLSSDYETNLTTLTEEEILDIRGIAYGGSDTLQGEIGSYSDYIVDYRKSWW